MIDSATQQIPRPQRHGRRSYALRMCVAAATLALAASLAAIAFAGTTVTVGSASSSKLGEQVTINSQGRTLYALSPETTHHLLCKTSECLRFWPPVTVPSSKTKLKAGPGVQGRLGILHRHGGLLQVTLRGMPLYRFSKDHARGDVEGQDVESFGGTWHAVTASSSATPPAPGSPPATPTTPTPSPTPPYGY